MGGKFGFSWFTTAPIDFHFILWVLIGVAAIAFAVSYGLIRYRHWQRFKEFENEMKTLDLNPQQEGTLAEMVRRYKVGEPVQVLYSPKLFDDIATAEMRRILGSQGSTQAKESFINTIYEIRTKTYHPDWLM